MGNRDFKQEFLNKSDQCLNGSGNLMSLTHCETLAGIRISSASELYPFAIREEYKGSKSTTSRFYWPRARGLYTSLTVAFYSILMNK